MKRNQQGSAVPELLLILVWLISLYGWAFNIVKLIQTGTLDHITGMLIARVIGILVFPLGAVLGFF